MLSKDSPLRFVIVCLFLFEQIFFPLQCASRPHQALSSLAPPHQEVQYLCLDHEARNTPQTPKGVANKNIIGASAPSVVYKKVDFVKTDAFNKMRINVEDTYRKNQWIVAL